MDLTIDQKAELICKDTDECVGADFKDILKATITERQLVVYWGTATTGVPHYGYFIPLLKIKDLLSAGCKVKILIADLHALLDSQKSQYVQLESRSIFYEKLIRVLISNLGISSEIIEANLLFIRGSSFQLSSEYMLDKLKLEAKIRISQALRASSEVVKQQEDPEVGSLTYPMMQALDEQYLDVDMQIGGRDQRKIFMFARTALPLLGYKKRLHLLTKMLPGLQQQEKDIAKAKMSSSDKLSKIEFFDEKTEINKKLKSAFAEPGNVENSPFLKGFKLIIFPIFGEVIVERKEKFGGNMLFENWEKMEESYHERKIHPLDLKICLGQYLEKLIGKVRKEIKEGELKESFINGYPDIAKDLNITN